MNAFLEYITGPRKRLILILMLTAIHSFFVGLGLIIQLPDLMILFGFDHIQQPFFPAQGGVFHIIMAAAYFIAARKPESNSPLIAFIIGVKITAALFLFLYFVFIQKIWMILFSGLGDGIMAILILTAYRSFTNSSSKKNE